MRDLRLCEKQSRTGVQFQCECATFSSHLSGVERYENELIQKSYKGTFSCTQTLVGDIKSENLSTVNKYRLTNYSSCANSLRKTKRSMQVPHI